MTSDDFEPAECRAAQRPDGSWASEYRDGVEDHRRADHLLVPDLPAGALNARL